MLKEADFLSDKVVSLFANWLEMTLVSFLPKFSVYVYVLYFSQKTWWIPQYIEQLNWKLIEFNSIEKANL